MSAASRVLFLTIVAAELVHTGVAIVQHHIPAGDDGFLHFSLFYFFLNNAIQSQEVAQWIPYINHGSVAAIWYGINAGFVPDVLLWIAPALRHADLLSVYHAGVFVDEMILLTGTWLLARRFFRLPTVFFIAVSVLGSCVWLDQPYLNFRLYYALPLVLDFGHRFLDTGRWRFFALAGNLLAMQALGIDAYFIALTSFVVFAYFAWHAAANHRVVWARLRALEWGTPAALAIVVAALSFGVAAMHLAFGTDHVVNAYPGRGPDGRVDLAGFLTFGGSTDVFKWIEMVVGRSPWPDMSLYAGILVPPLCLCSLVSMDRRRLHFALLAATVLLFTSATWVSVAVFYVWPGMSFVHHIGVAAPLVKVLLCFVAGIGFDRFLEARPKRRGWAFGAAGVAGASLLVGAAAFALRLANSGPAVGNFVGVLAGVPHEALAGQLRASAAVAIAGAALMLIVSLLAGSTRFADSRRARIAALAIVLVFVTADVYRFKFNYLFDRSATLGAEALMLLRPAPLAFNDRRAVDLSRAVSSSPRLQAGLTAGRASALLGRSLNGGLHPFINTFYFLDEAGLSHAWHTSIDQFFRAYGALAQDDAALPEGGHRQFPRTHPAAAVLAGVTAAKIRVFSHAYGVVSPEALVPLMTDPAYAGNLLFVVRARTGPSAFPGWSGQVPLSTDQTRPVTYRVERFDANNLIVEVINPDPVGAYMSYADVWHPLWRATVNGQAVPVYRANMAYKAVPIASGRNVVHFQFGSTLFETLAAVHSVNALFWLGAAAVMFAGVVRRPQERA